MTLRRGAVIEKVRSTIPWHGLMWEVDVFGGDNAGLVIAEIELRHEHQNFASPRWLGAEVTGQGRYYNRALSQQPFCTWPRRTPRARQGPDEAPRGCAHVNDCRSPQQGRG
jgi:adenylate cyclase